MAQITLRDRRILTAIKCLSENESDSKPIEELEAHYKAHGNLKGQEKAAENAFKAALMSFAMNIIEKNVAMNWPWPIKGIVVQLIKIVCWPVIKFGVCQQLWQFLSDVESDQKFRSLLWARLLQRATILLQ